MNKKSICFVIPKFVTFATGGAELQVHWLSQEFLQRGWQVEVVCAGAAFRSRARQSEYFDARIRYHYYQPSVWKFMDGWKVLRVLLACKSYWFYNRTDSAATGALAWFARVRNRKMIYALACDEDALPGKYLSEFSQYSYKNGWKKRVRLWDVRLLDRWVEYGKRNAHLLLAQTNQQQQLLTQKMKLHASLLPNGFRFESVSPSEKKNLVIWVGNFRPIKQPEYFPMLVDSLTECPDWEFVMIGKPYPDFTNSVPGRIRKRVRVVGELSYTETLNYFAQAKILVNTSRAEGFPNTFVQAAVTGCSVASLWVDPDGWLEANGCGKSLGGDFQLLQHYVKQLMWAGEIGCTTHLAECRTRIQREYSIAGNTNRLLELMAQIDWR